jgi:iron complex outermembrane receptor protein
VHYDRSTLAFSPSAILNGFLNFHYAGFRAVWHTNFVSRQYIDNTENKDRSLPSYSQTNVKLDYTWNVAKKFAGLKEVVIGLNLNNIFDRHYASSAWVYSAIVGDKYPENNRYYQLGYIPMAGFTAMGNITLKF